MKRPAPAIRSQRGYALAILLVLVVVGGAALTLRSINAASLRADRYRITQEALIKAKEALIARAVLDANVPGSLPCPDTDDDGSAELLAGNDCPSYIGRLPWKTLGLPDLRDANGERLWYALSRNFRDDDSARPVNSDTQGTLTVLGTQPVGNATAIVFSTGTALQRADGVTQSRSNSNAINYLDLAGGTDNAGGGTTFISAPESETFNDRLLPIMPDDILPLVEKRVAREFAQKLRDHFDAWQNAPNVTQAKGFYPWAAPFNDPAAASPGVNGTTNGQLPRSATSVVWANAPAPTFDLGSCVGAGTTQITCTGVVACDPVACVFNISARVQNIGTAFVNPPDGSEVTVSVSSELAIGGATTTWTLNAAAQALDFSYGGSFLGIGDVTVQVRVPSTAAWPTDTTYWPIANNWHQLAYYALSPGYAINGTNSCDPGTDCVSIANAAGPNNDKEAVIVMTGRTLTGQAARPVTPPASVSDFLENGNQTPADLAFEQNLRGSGFNDQPAVVRPCTGAPPSC